MKQLAKAQAEGSVAEPGKAWLGLEGEGGFQ